MKLFFCLYKEAWANIGKTGEAVTDGKDMITA